MDKDEQRLWEWCGLYQERESGGLVWKDVNNFLVPNLELTLDNLFKYAYPQIPENKRYGVLFYWIGRVVEGQDPTQALFKAFMKVINEPKEE